MPTQRGRRPQLRIAVNSRCGRACFYCRPSGEAVATGAGIALQPDDLTFFVAAAAELGMTDIKITGGDPALYSPLIEVVGKLKRNTAVQAIEVISRHPHIGELAPGLRDAGVDRFNVSLDTLNPVLHRRICGVDDLPLLLKAVAALVKTGMPVKINMVIMRGVNDAEIFDMVAYCGANGVHSLKLLDVIEDLDNGTEFNFARLRRQGKASSLADLYTPLSAVSELLRQQATDLEIQHQGDFGHPMTVFRMPNNLRVIVKDSRAGQWYGQMCSGCKFFPCHDALMALRLTPDLRAQFCLLRDDVTVDLAPVIKKRDELLLQKTLLQVCGEYETATFFDETMRAAQRRALPGAAA